MSSEVRPQQVAVVTGGASGIGRACAIRLSADGYAVAVADLDEVGAKATVDLLPRAVGLAIQTDVTSADSVDAMVDRVLDRYDKIDALVCSAGIAGPSVPVWNVSPQEWDAVISTNLRGVFLCCRRVAVEMSRNRWGRIVNIASIAGKEGNPNAAAYSASKAGVIAFSKSLGKELATSGVLVNTVTPAVIDTPILAQISKEHIEYMISRIPMGRVGTPEEVAALVSWLCSPECSYSAGAVFDLSGGRATY